MKIDKKTLEDLGIHNKNGGVKKLLDHCITSGGSFYLKNAIQTPLPDYNKLIDVQQAVKNSLLLIDAWPEMLNNGTFLMVEKFFSATESIISKPTPVSLFLDKITRKLFPKNEQSLIKFSITQVIDFVKYCHIIIDKYKETIDSALLQDIIKEMEQILSNEYFVQLNNTSDSPNYSTLLRHAYYTRRFLKNGCHQLMQLLYQIDYYRSLAIAIQNNNWTMPEISENGHFFYAKNLRHPLLEKPTAYDVHISPEKNFIFLTGANMSGKSTYMKSIGIAAYLAHIGCGVPASSLQLSFLNALITNMQIEDNIYTGESYFLAEVLRMKNTALQIQEQENNLILMDELFKGTNIHDAYECTETVIQALVKKRKNLYCLSTHLYELGDKLQSFDNIQFQYFETIIDDSGNYRFNYQLKNGVSNDKIGYWVLKKEGVITILSK